MAKGILILLAVIVILGGVLMQHKEKGVALALVLVLFSFSSDILSEVLADMVKPLFFGSDAPVSEEDRRPDSTSAVQAGASLSPAPEPDSPPEEPSAPVTEPSAPVEGTEAPPAPEEPPKSEPPADPLSGLSDISGQSSFSGSLVEKEQVNQYRYTAPTDGTYLFDSGQSYGVLSLTVSNAYGGKLFDGSAAASGELEAGKSYIVSVRYGNKPTDYSVSIGVPNPVTDVSGQASVSGSLTYRNQCDGYTYTAPVDGVYRFDSGRDFGALSVDVRNAQGTVISKGSTSAEATLEAGKTYTLSVSHTHNLLDYTILFYIPQPVTDITAQSGVSGTLTYYGQRDEYTYLPPADGSYCFDTGVGYGGVSMELTDQTGRRVDRGSCSLTVSLRAGEVYTLSVYKEYANLPMEYTISVSAQQDLA